MTPLKKYLEAVQARANAATPGPWKQHGMKWNSVMREHYAKLTAGEAPDPSSKYSRPITVGYLQLEDSDYRPFDKDVQEELPMEANAAFISASRTDVPKLVAMCLEMDKALGVAMRYCEAGAVESSPEESLSSVIDEALAAVAKIAEGE